jgi:hypothetical protein
MGGVVVLPWRVEDRAFRRVVIVVARVVFPFLFSNVKEEWKGMKVIPEPGIPEIAIRKRWVGGMVWNFAGLGG